MTEAPEISVFFVGASTHGQGELNARLTRSGISLEHFDAAGPCREALGVRHCHLLVIDLDGNAIDSLQLLGDSEPTVARTPKLALVDHGDIPIAVQAIRAGAANCLEKPVDSERLFGEIKALLRQVDRSGYASESTLTPAETTVLRLVLEGKTNHETSQALHRSPRTIEVHRRHIMQKLGASSMVDLVKRASARGLFEA